MLCYNKMSSLLQQIKSLDINKQNTITIADSLSLDTLTTLDANVLGNATVGGDLFVKGIELDAKITNATSGKQDTLTPGTNITIDENNVISSSDGGSTIDSTTDISCNTLTTVGDITCGGIITEDNKPSFRVFSNSATLQATKALLFNTTETVDFNINGTYYETGTLSGIYEATVSGTYWVHCKLRLDDGTTEQCEIQWYKKNIDNTFTKYETFEMWMGPSHTNRRAGYSACLIRLEVGEGVFPRSDLTGGVNLTNSYVVFAGYRI